MVDKKYERGIISKAVGKWNWEKINCPSWLIPDEGIGTKYYMGRTYEYKVVCKLITVASYGGRGDQPTTYHKSPNYKFYRRPKPTKRFTFK